MALHPMSCPILQTLRDCSCGPDQCQAGDRYVHEFEEVLRYSMPKGKIGGFFAESIQVGVYCSKILDAQNKLSFLNSSLVFKARDY